jgi:hypothetical protein
VLDELSSLCGWPPPTSEDANDISIVLDDESESVEDEEELNSLVKISLINMVTLAPVRWLCQKSGVFRLWLRDKTSACTVIITCSP